MTTAKPPSPSISIPGCSSAPCTSGTLTAPCSNLQHGPVIWGLLICPTGLLPRPANGSLSNRPGPASRLAPGGSPPSALLHSPTPTVAAPASPTAPPHKEPHAPTTTGP